MILLKQTLEVNVGHVTGVSDYLSSFALVSQAFRHVRSGISLPGSGKPGMCPTAVADEYLLVGESSVTIVLSMVSTSTKEGVWSRSSMVSIMKSNRTRRISGIHL